MNRTFVRLGELLDNFDSKRVPVKAADRRPGPFPYYGASGIVDYVDGYIFDGEYLLVAEDGENLRSRNTPIAFLADGRFWVNNHAHVVRANDRSSTKFLALLLSVTDIAPYITGSAQPKLSRSSLDAIRVSVPPLVEQQAIAEVLGALDDKIAANSKLAELHDNWAATAYTGLVRDLAWAPMSSKLTAVLGGTPARDRKDYWNGDAPWLSVKDVVGASAGVVIGSIEHITNTAIAETKAKPLPRGSVILTARGTVGEVARLGLPASINQSCYGFLPDRLPASVLYFAIQGAVEQIRRLVHGSVFDTITKRTFDHVHVPDFSTEEASVIDSKVRPHLDAAEALTRESAALTRLRDALLPELMSGRLRVKDAERTVEEVI